MVNFEIDAVDVISDILERNPGTDFRFTYWAPSGQLKVVLCNYETWTNVIRLIGKDNYFDVCRILLEMEKEYQDAKAKLKKE